MIKLGVRCRPDEGYSDRYADGKWIVTLRYCVFIVDDQTGVATSR